MTFYSKTDERYEWDMRANVDHLGRAIAAANATAASPRAVDRTALESQVKVITKVRAKRKASGPSFIC